MWGRLTGRSNQARKTMKAIEEGGVDSSTSTKWSARVWWAGAGARWSTCLRRKYGSPIVKTADMLDGWVCRTNNAGNQYNKLSLYLNTTVLDILSSLTIASVLLCSLGLLLTQSSTLTRPFCSPAPVENARQRSTSHDRRQPTHL